MLTLRVYQRTDGSSPFAAWFDELDDAAHARVTRFIARLEQGNTSNVKPVGSGVSELKIDLGPGYRVYFGMDGRTLVILLGGGTKKRQSADIKFAQQGWADYKQRKEEE
jgi:putative addiction module killer protein